MRDLVKRNLAMTATLLLAVAIPLGQVAPLKYGDIITALSARLPAGMTKQQLVENLIQDVRKRGLDRPLTQDIEDLLRQAGAPSQLISVIKSSAPPQEVVRLRTRLVLRLVHAKGTHPSSVQATDLMHTVDVIQKRLQALGLAGFVVRQLPTERNLIEVKIPAVDDHELVKWLIHIQGRIELIHILNPEPNRELLPFSSHDRATAFLARFNFGEKRILPNYSCQESSTRNSSIKFLCPTQPNGWIVGSNHPLAEGLDCLRITYQLRADDVWSIECTMKRTSSDRLKDWMRVNEGEYVGTVLDGQINDFFYIKSPNVETWGVYFKGLESSASALSRVLVLRPLPVDVQLQYQSEELIDEVHNH